MASGKNRMTVVDYETLSKPEPYHSSLTVMTATVCELLEISKDDLRSFETSSFMSF